MHLLEHARKRDPLRGTEPLARFYSVILLLSARADARQYGDYAGLAAQVRYNVESSREISLVGTVATDLVDAAATEALDPRSQADFVALRALGTELVTEAQALDPGNQAWSDLMEGIKALPR